MARIRRRTPLLAIILAPVALYLLVALWNDALVPLYRSVRYSDTVLQRRLNSEEPAIRIAATKDIGSPRVVDVALIDELVERLQTDESAGVRDAAATALGQRGSLQPLTARAIDALSMRVLSEQDDASLSAVIVAVGRSAPNNRYPDGVIERIAGIFGEKHSSWLYQRAATTLGQIGAMQPLPDTVFAVMNTLFLDPVHPGEREYLAHAFTEIAKGGLLPVPTLDILAAAFAAESNRRIRIAILFGLAYMASDYPHGTNVITAATSDPDSDIVRTAEHGLRIVEANRIFANTDPLTLAMNRAAPVDERLKGLQVIRGSTIDPVAFAPIASLAQDPETEIAVAALEIMYRLARNPNDDFDQRVLIPALSRAMSSSDPLVRNAAYGALSTISIHRRDYLHAADFPARLDTGANDPDPKVRVVVLLATIRAASAMSQRDSIIERGMNDADPYVRRMAAGWLGSPRIRTSRRQEFIARALNDPDPAVRASAAAASKDWGSRKRSWPIALWQRWQAGERKEVGMTILIAVTVATPVLICGAFLLYYLARLLAYLLQRRWRVVAVVVVLGTWVAASYGMIMAYFMAAHIGNADTGEIMIVAAALWGTIVAYTALGWGMHYAVRR